MFGRLWEETGCRALIEDLARRRGFGFSLERAVFATVLHRLMVSGSDRACERWLEAYRLDGAETLELHQLYRAMTWLGEELADQSGATRAPRRTKDVIEEQLFARRRNLFADLSVVLFTTSLYFYGAGGESLGQHGKSKDHRPDLKQVIVGVVVDEAGRPICSETWPGNATDVKALLPVVDRLRQRFGIARMCVVADRGMISAETMAELDARGIEYILGARERSDKEVREIVLADTKPMVPLAITRARGEVTELEVKEVIIGDWGPSAKPRRYIVCFNPQEAKRDAAVREEVVRSLAAKLEYGDKGLVGNAGYRRFLATPRDGHFEIDPDRVADDARFDGLYVLHTNSKLDTLSVALAYRELWRVEQIFWTAKESLDEAERDLVLRLAVGGDSVPMTIDHLSELLVRFEALPLQARAPVVEEAPRPALAFVLQSWPKDSLSRYAVFKPLVSREQRPSAIACPPGSGSRDAKAACISALDVAAILAAEPRVFRSCALGRAPHPDGA